MTFSMLPSNHQDLTMGGSRLQSYIFVVTLQNFYKITDSQTNMTVRQVKIIDYLLHTKFG